jgi:hypothetical protein
VVAAVVTTAALPDASAARAASSIDRPAAGASAPAPGACSSPASAALGEGGAGFHLSGEPTHHHSPLLPPLPTTSSSGSPGERAPAAHAPGTPRSVAPSAPAAGCSSPSCVRPAPAPVVTRRERLLGPGVWAGQTMRRPQSSSAEKRIVKTALVHREGIKKGGKPTHRLGVGEHDEQPELVVAMSPDLEANGAPRPRGRILLGEAVVQQL